jgi:hypothetical protein
MWNRRFLLKSRSFHNNWVGRRENSTHDSLLHRYQLLIINFKESIFWLWNYFLHLPKTPHTLCTLKPLKKSPSENIWSKSTINSQKEWEWNTQRWNRRIRINCHVTLFSDELGFLIKQCIFFDEISENKMFMTSL